MQPIFLDGISVAFPELKIIGAHLGYGLYDSAAAVARWRRNVFFDISGGTVVRRHLLERNMLRSEVSTRKLTWGSDCDMAHMSRELSDWMQAFNESVSARRNRTRFSGVRPPASSELTRYELRSPVATSGEAGRRWLDTRFHLLRRAADWELFYRYIVSVRGSRVAGAAAELGNRLRRVPGLAPPRGPMLACGASLDD